MKKSKVTAWFKENWKWVALGVGAVAAGFGVGYLSENFTIVNLRNDKWKDKLIAQYNWNADLGYGAKVRGRSNFTVRELEAVATHLGSTFEQACIDGKISENDIIGLNIAFTQNPENEGVLEILDGIGNGYFWSCSTKTQPEFGSCITEIEA